MIYLRKYIVILILLCLFPLKVHALNDTSKSSIVMDLDSGRILYQKNAEEKRLIASITKILTAITTLENTKDLNKEITVGEEVLKMYGTNIYIEVGEKIKIKDLLYGLLLRSGNDASVTLANTVCKKEKDFVKLMNKKAQDIGMKNSSFANPHGLDEETKNYSTAHDMALLSVYAYKNKIYKEISKTKKYEVKTKNKTYLWYNRNKLLSNYKYCTGGKNGYTPSAGKTLVTTASKNKLNLTIVTLNDPNVYQTHEDLYEYMFSKYQNYTIVDKNNFSIDKSFYDGEAYLKKSFTYPLTKEEVSKIKTELHITSKKTKSKKVGTITIKLEDKKIGELEIYNKKTKQKKESKTFLQKMKSLFLG